MDSVIARRTRCAHALLAFPLAFSLALALTACGGGGGTGTEKDSGVNKTYLSVDVADADGDALTYQWRVTGGTVENRNAKETVWTMPDGPGLHFAYVVVSDGKGGYASQQYAVSSDTLGTSAPTPVARSNLIPVPSAAEGSTDRLRIYSADTTLFSAAGVSGLRRVYMADVQVQVTKVGGSAVFTGPSDLNGEVKLPKLEAGLNNYQVCLSTSQGVPLAGDCRLISGSGVADVRELTPALSAGRNLHAYGHVGLADGGACGAQNEYFGIQSAATVQLRMADGTPLSAPTRVNRFGDYAVDAAAPVVGKVQLAVQCEGYSSVVDVPAPAGGYVGGAPIEVPHVVIPNSRPQLVKMVAVGADGNVRGKMIVAEADASSNALPGPDRFLTYKGQDTKVGACQYYVALGAAASCDAQGNLVNAISFTDWKRLNGFAPTGSTTEYAANYINKRDLNLVRRMVATQMGPQHIAFYVCNSPGPVGTSQQEVDDVLDTGLNDEKRIACVAMEWSVSAGTNGDLPFTKFFTFGPTGSLLASVNLDGRGEKYLPGACVACHGGNKYNGKFPEKEGASAHLGANFLPFDTNNYLFSSKAGLSEAAQSAQFFELNRLVRMTETDVLNTATSKLIRGWYDDGATTTLNKSYLPQAWQDLKAEGGVYSDADEFYHQVVGSSCRTCHTSLGATFNWDGDVSNFRNGGSVKLVKRFCGGDFEIAVNASMPNALITHDRLFERARSDPALANLMTKYLGCSAPRPDPVFPQR